MITGIILAGGQSSRMGSDKALLPIDGKPLIELVIDRLRPCVERMLVVGHAGNARRFATLPVDRVVEDLCPGRGPLMGIYTGLMAIDTPLALIVPCDMPWIQAALIARLVQACRDDAQAVASLLPADGIQPFPLLCRLSACRRIGALLNRDERSVHALLCHAQTQLIDVVEPELWRSFMNVNTLADYASLTDDTTLTSR